MNNPCIYSVMDKVKVKCSFCFVVHEKRMRVFLFPHVYVTNSATHGFSNVVISNLLLVYNGTAYIVRLWLVYALFVRSLLGVIKQYIFERSML